MKTVQITNIANEVVELTHNDFKIFVDVVKFDDNLSKCEIFFEKSGWVYLQNQLEEVEGRSIEDIIESDDLDGVLENFFEGHMFTNYFSLGIED
jgi:hypothetical protein